MKAKNLLVLILRCSLLKTFELLITRTFSNRKMSAQCTMRGVTDRQTDGQTDYTVAMLRVSAAI